MGMIPPSAPGQPDPTRELGWLIFAALAGCIVMLVGAVVVSLLNI